MVNDNERAYVCKYVCVCVKERKKQNKQKICVCGYLTDVCAVGCVCMLSKRKKERKKERKKDRMWEGI